MPVELTEADLEGALPDVTSTLRLPGLIDAVTIYRDRWGIPHIRAGNEHDVFFAQGFATAQDRLWHMDYDRFRALGRWAEIAGPDGVGQDRLLRTAGMGRTAGLDYESAGAEAKAMVDAYAAGVNAFLETTSAFPVEYKLLDRSPEPWENWHCIAVYKMRNTLLGTFEPKLFRTRLALRIGPGKAARIIKGYPGGHLLTVPPGEVYRGPAVDGLEELGKALEDVNWLKEADAGSNAWAISGERTRSGLPLMGGDSHRALDTPSVYYQAHLSCPEFSIIGSSIPGMPGILHFCHNEHVGWGMTYGNADTQDLFVERFRERAGRREYEFEDTWRQAEVLHETITVRNAEAVEIEVTVTHHGPVIAGNPEAGYGIAISDPGLIRGTPWLDAARDAMLATTVEELHGAFGSWTDRVNNYAVVDVHGGFGYLHEGKIPIRTEANGWRAVPGWTGKYEWKGYIPHDDLPRAIRPRAGYAVTCNQRVAGHDYPYYVGLYFSPEYRAKRLQTDILDLKPGMATVEDMARMHADRTSIPARIFTRAVLKVKAPDAESGRALALLREWDYRMDRDLPQPTIYSQTRLCTTRILAEHLLGDMAAPALEGAPGAEAHVRLIVLEMILGLERGDGSMLPDGRSWEDLLAESLRQAVGDLRERLGDEMSGWKWGRVHHTRPRHPLSQVFPECARLLDPPCLPTHGDGDVPLAGGYDESEPFVATGMSVNRYIHDPSDWSNSLWIVPLGASGHPGSAHYSDQAQLWANVGYIPQLWDWETIASEAETRQVLEPGEGRDEKIG